MLGFIVITLFTKNYKSRLLYPINKGRKSTIISLGSNKLESKHFISFIQTYKNIVFSYFFVIKKMLSHFFVQNIFDPCVKSKITFYTFQNNI